MNKNILRVILIIAFLVLGFALVRIFLLVRPDEPAIETQAVVLDTGSVHWDDPAVEIGHRACTLLDFEDARLIEHVRVVSLDDGSLHSDQTRDTGLS